MPGGNHGSSQMGAYPKKMAESLNAEKINNLAATKAPFKSRARLAGQDGASGGHPKTSRKFTAPKRQHKQA